MTEIWYVIEHSRIGDDDWFALDNRTFDSQNGALQKMRDWIEKIRDNDEYEYRVVKKTLASEVISVS